MEQWVVDRIGSTRMIPKRFVRAVHAKAVLFREEASDG
jgi:hypothetical protein